MSLTLTDLQACHAALVGYSEDDREPEHYRAWYGETAARVQKEIDRVKAWQQPPQFTTDPCTQQVIMFRTAVRLGVISRLRWVMTQEFHDKLLAEARARQTAPVPDGRGIVIVDPDLPPPPVVSTLFGIHIRVDDHATTIMLELR